jgi:hypothetical protein
MRRIATMLVLCVVASTAAIAVESTAYAAAENKVWVDAAGKLQYQYQPSGPTTNVVIRNSGSTVTIDDAIGIYAGSGCWYPSPGDGTLVYCTGLTTDVWVRPGPAMISWTFS